MGLEIQLSRVDAFQPNAGFLWGVQRKVTPRTLRDRCVSIALGIQVLLRHYCQKRERKSLAGPARLSSLAANEEAAWP